MQLAPIGSALSCSDIPRVKEVLLNLFLFMCKMCGCVLMRTHAYAQSHVCHTCAGTHKGQRQHHIP